MDVEREQQEHARRLEQGRRALAGLDEDWARHVQAIGPCRLALPPEVEPWEALLRAIVYQQLHGRAAGAIHQRLLALYPAGRPTPRDLLATSPEQLRLCGLSAAKEIGRASCRGRGWVSAVGGFGVDVDAFMRLAHRNTE